MFNSGDYVITSVSEKPAIIIENLRNLDQEDQYLVSISEYNGDYIWLDDNNIARINLLPEEKLSILANFDDWFYKTHTLLYQEIILDTLYTYFNKS